MFPELLGTYCLPKTLCCRVPTPSHMICWSMWALLSSADPGSRSFLALPGPLCSVGSVAWYHQLKYAQSCHHSQKESWISSSLDPWLFTLPISFFPHSQHEVRITYPPPLSLAPYLAYHFNPAQFLKTLPLVPAVISKADNVAHGSVLALVGGLQGCSACFPTFPPAWIPFYRSARTSPMPIRPSSPGAAHPIPHPHLP